MILLRDVHKRYLTNHGQGPWILKGITLDIPKNVNVGLIGGNGAGKSTLLRLIAGVDQPSKGTIERQCRVSWPMGGSGFQAQLTGRQNAKFICRIFGHDGPDMADRIAFVQSFADIGAAFDEQVRNYSSGMRSRLTFALSLAFEFDVYISDETTAAGDTVFRQKAAAAFKSMVDRAGLIMVAHGESTLKQFCQAGIYLHHGQAHWFDNIDDALKAYQSSTQKAMQLAGVEFDPEPISRQGPKIKAADKKRKGIGRKGMPPKATQAALAPDDAAPDPDSNKALALARQLRKSLQPTQQMTGQKKLERIRKLTKND